MCDTSNNCLYGETVQFDGHYKRKREKKGDRSQEAGGRRQEAGVRRREAMHCYENAQAKRINEILEQEY